MTEAEGGYAYQQYADFWKHLVAAEEGKLNFNERRAIAVRSACLLISDGLEELITNTQTQKDPIKQAEAMVKYAVGMSNLQTLNVAPNIHVGLEPEAYEDSHEILAEYVGGQLLHLRDEQLPSPINVVREIKEHVEQMQRVSPNDPNLARAARLDMNLLSPNFKNFQGLTAQVNLTNRLLASTVGQTPISPQSTIPM